MLEDLVLQKTSLGETALERHDQSLPPALRRILILVDGHTDAAGLRSKAPYPDLMASLEALRRDGYIASVREVSLLRASSTPAGSLKAQLAQICQDVMGDSHSCEKLKNKLVITSDDPAEIAATFRSCVKIARLTIDERKAAELERRGEALF